MYPLQSSAMPETAGGCWWFNHRAAAAAATAASAAAAAARYSAWDFKRLRVPTGRFVQLHAPVGDIPVHIRGGAVVPMQVG
jgi:hypothetical protein